MKPRMSRIPRMGLAAWGIVLLGTTVWQVFAQREPQTAYRTLPTRIVPNADGSVSVWFQSPAGSTNQVFSAEAPAETPAGMNWILVARLVATNAWSEWVDRGDAWRKPPGEVAERYYRVVKLEQETTEATEAEANQGVRPTGLDLLTEIGALIGASNLDGLRALLAAADLSVQQLLDLAETQRADGGCAVMMPFWETILTAKVKQGTAYQLAKTHIRLGECLYAQGRNQEAIIHLAACAALVPETDLAMEALHGTAFCYWNLGRPLEALPNLARVQGWNPPPKYRDFGRWLIAQTHVRAEQWAEARTVLVALEMTGEPVLRGIARQWQQNCDREVQRETATARRAEGAR